MLNTDNAFALIQSSRREGGNEAVYNNLLAEISKKTSRVTRDQVVGFAGPILNAVDEFDGVRAKALTDDALRELLGYAPEVFAEDETEPEGSTAEVADDDLPGRIKRLEQGMASTRDRVAELERIAQSRGLL
jgi:hypothetical protein